jgi:hypothetical protein
MKLKVLVGCEYSGAVRDAFIALGHDAMSCDILPTDNPGPHYQGDVMDIINDGWDIAVFHPPCTYLCNSGVRWLSTDPQRWPLMEEGAKFFKALLEADIPHIAVENPIMHKYAKAIIGRGQDCSVQPWEHGHGETKRTCFWLKNLPAIKPTNIVEGREGRIWKLSPGADRWKLRSQTYPGIAKAIAEQWSAYVIAQKEEDGQGT